MARELFDKALATWGALFGTDELRAALEDEQAEVSLLESRLADALCDLTTMRIELQAERAESQRLRAQLAELTIQHDAYRDTVREWNTAKKDMVQ